MDCIIICMYGMAGKVWCGVVWLVAVVLVVALVLVPVCVVGVSGHWKRGWGWVVRWCGGEWCGGGGGWWCGVALLKNLTNRSRRI